MKVRGNKLRWRQRLLFKLSLYMQSFINPSAVEDAVLLEVEWRHKDGCMEKVEAYSLPPGSPETDLVRKEWGYPTTLETLRFLRRLAEE